MHVEVDRDLCEANAVCVGVAPQVFSLGDDDLAAVADAEISKDNEELVRQAVELCPKVALRLTDS